MCAKRQTFAFLADHKQKTFTSFTCKIISLAAIVLTSARIVSHLKSISYSIRFLLQRIIFNNVSIQRLRRILQRIVRLYKQLCAYQMHLGKIYFQKKKVSSGL